MHELSISSEVVQTVLNSVKENGGQKVLSIVLEIGEMTLLNEEQVKFWIEELLKGTVAEGAKIRIKKKKVWIECESCKYKGRPLLDQKLEMSIFGPFYCPKCKAFRVEVKEGNGCTLKRIQMIR